MFLDLTRLDFWVVVVVVLAVVGGWVVVAMAVAVGLWVVVDSEEIFSV